MNNQKTTETELPVPEVSRDKIIEYLNTSGLTKELAENEQRQFIEIAYEFQLNPFKKEIYCFPYGEGQNRKLSIIVGYEVYIKRAERTGKLDGWKVWVENSGKETKAIIEIHRKDWTKPFRHEVFFEEAVQRKKNGSITWFWVKQPKFQLKKVAISQGFRLCFPDELAGMPYIADELPEEMSTTKMRNVSPSQSEPPSKQKKPVETKTSLLESPKPPEDQLKPEPQSGANSEENKSLMDRIDSILKSNASCFTTNHTDWIRKQIAKDSTINHLNKILDHIGKVIEAKSKTPQQIPKTEKATETQSKEPALII